MCIKICSHSYSWQYYYPATESISEIYNLETKVSSSNLTRAGTASAAGSAADAWMWLSAEEGLNLTASAASRNMFSTSSENEYQLKFNKRIVYRY